MARPIFVSRCAACHGDTSAKSGLRLDQYEAAIKGGKHGPDIVPGDVSSPLVRRLLSPAKDRTHMPPLSEPQPTADETAALKWWVQAGAPENGTLADLKVPADVRDAIQRMYPSPGTGKEAATQPAK